MDSYAQINRKPIAAFAQVFMGRKSCLCPILYILVWNIPVLYRTLDVWFGYRWAPKMEDKDIAPNTYSWSSRYGKNVAPVHYIPVPVGTFGIQARLSAQKYLPTGSAVCIWQNFLVFHFEGSSMKKKNLFLYGLDFLPIQARATPAISFNGYTYWTTIDTWTNDRTSNDTWFNVTEGLMWLKD